MEQKSNCTGRLDTKAFTLIELLVVVLIIGILAAIALPQYQKAVEKSKATQALTMLKSVYQAAKAYSLANGNWPTSFDELAVDIPWTGTEKWATGGVMSLGRSNEDWALQLSASGDYGRGVLVGRISGPYVGAAFSINEVSRSSSEGREKIPTETIICIEGHANNEVINPFTQVTGNYCAKLFKGTLINTGHASNYFKLP